MQYLFNVYNTIRAFMGAGAGPEQGQSNSNEGPSSPSLDAALLENKARAPSRSKRMKKAFSDENPSKALIYRQPQNNSNQRLDLTASSDSECDIAPEIKKINSLAETCLQENETNTLVSIGNYQLRGQEFKRLLGHDWLNDEIINAYMQLLQKTSNNVYCFNSFFYSQLTAKHELMHAYHFDRVKRWTHSVDLFSKDLVLLPINVKNQHWILGAINLKEKRFELYDSFHPSKKSRKSALENYKDSNQEYFLALRSYLRAEHINKKHTEIDLSDWTDAAPCDIPKQENGIDCGIFILKFARALFEKKPMTFTQAHMPEYRKQIAQECLNKQLFDQTNEPNLIPDTKEQKKTNVMVSTLV